MYAYATYHPSGDDGGFKGIGSVAVKRRQWYLHSAGLCISCCHFFDTFIFVINRRHLLTQEDAYRFTADQIMDGEQFENIERKVR